MRILDRGNIQVSIKDLGFAEDDLRPLSADRQTAERHTSSSPDRPAPARRRRPLYAAMNEPGNRILTARSSTAEDPVEYYLPGDQPVRGPPQHRPRLPEHHPGHAGGKRPNIILVGEIRDKEDGRDRHPGVADGSPWCSSTLHTNDAPSAITRLVDIEVYNRFVVCVERDRHPMGSAARCGLSVPCARTADTPPDTRDQGVRVDRRNKLKTATFMKGRGCGNCNRGGYRGRLGIYEMLTMSSEHPRADLQAAQAVQDISAVPLESSCGMRTLLEDGLMKAMKGVTTLEEVLGTCHHESSI